MDSCKTRFRPEVILKYISVVLLLLAAFPTFYGQTNKSDELIVKAINAIDQGQLSEAAVLLNSALAMAPNDADVLNLLGVVRAKQNRPTEAERLFRRALASSPSHLGAHINLSELLLSTNRPEQAMPILLRAHKLAPDRPEIN